MLMRVTLCPIHGPLTCHYDTLQYRITQILTVTLSDCVTQLTDTWQWAQQKSERHGGQGSAQESFSCLFNHRKPVINEKGTKVTLFTQTCLDVMAQIMIKINKKMVTNNNYNNNHWHISLVTHAILIVTSYMYTTNKHIEY